MVHDLFPDTNPWKRLPVLESDEGALACSNAIARHIARMRPDVGLLGVKNEETYQIEAWMEFVRKEVEVPAGLLT